MKCEDNNNKNYIINNIIYVLTFKCSFSDWYDWNASHFKHYLHTNSFCTRPTLANYVACTHSIPLNNMWQCEQLPATSIGLKTPTASRGFISAVKDHFGPNQPMHKYIRSQTPTSVHMFFLTGKQNQLLCVSCQALSLPPNTTCSGMLSKRRCPCCTFQVWGCML